MKHIKYIRICFALLLLLTACGGKNAGGAANNAPVAATPATGNTAPESGIVNTIGEDNALSGESANYHLEITTPSAGDTTLEFFITNTSGEDAEILLIPTLEIMTEDGTWEIIAFDESNGFCGTKDPLPTGGKSWSVELDKLWNNLYKGEYRLSCTVTDAKGREFTAAGEFTLTYDIVQIART